MAKADTQPLVRVDGDGTWPSALWLITPNLCLGGDIPLLH